MSTLKVGTIQSTTANTAMTIAADGKVTGPNGLAGGISSGFVKLGSQNWTTDTAAVDFDIVDRSKYINYMLYWYISHRNTASSGNQWTETAFQFRTSGGAYTTSDYDNNVQWIPSSSTSGPDYNNSTYAGIKGLGWLAGNGTNYDSHGQAIISVPDHPEAKVSIRSKATLLYRPGTGTNMYMEESSSSCRTLNPQTVTGFRIRSWQGDTHTSRYGSIQIYGLEK